MSNDKTEQPIPETEWVPANKNHDIIIQAGDRIRIYGNQTIVEGFYGIYNEGLERWETIILTTKRGDPFERTINDIEVDADKKHINPHSLPPSPVVEVGERFSRKEVVDIKINALDNCGENTPAAKWFDRNYPPSTSQNRRFSFKDCEKYRGKCIGHGRECIEDDCGNPPNPSRAGEISPVLRDWISVKDRLPELTEPFMMYDDDNVRKVAWENDHVFVLAFDPERGIIKAKRDKRGWSEVSTNSISGCVTITHWQHLPGKPGEGAAPTAAPEVKEEPGSGELEEEGLGLGPDDPQQRYTPVKDTPVEQKDPEEIRCSQCGTTNAPDKDGVFRKECWHCKEFLEEAGPYSAFYKKVPSSPTEQPAQVPVAKTECTCICGPTDTNPNCAWPNCFNPEEKAIPEPKGEIPEEIMEWIADQLDERGILAGSNIFKEGSIAMYRKMQEEDVMKANTRYSDTILDLRKAEKAVATLTKERDELKSKVDNKVIPIREPELIPSESIAYVTMADGSRSRTLGELFQLIPQAHRKKIMGATGPGTSLCAVLEYVARYGEEIISQCNQQREDVKQELEQVKLSFHQAVEEIKRLTDQLSGK